MMLLSMYSSVQALFKGILTKQFIVRLHIHHYMPDSLIIVWYDKNRLRMNLPIQHRLRLFIYCSAIFDFDISRLKIRMLNHGFIIPAAA